MKDVLGKGASRVSSLLVEGGKKIPKLKNFAGSGPWWVLVAALCRAVCCFPYQCAGAHGIDCWKGIKKLPDKLFFCWINSTEDEKHFYSDSGTCSQKKEGFSCCTEHLTHVLQWRKVEHSSCHFSFPLWDFVPAADIEETSQSWGSFSVNIDLWQKKRMDFRKKIPVFRVLSFPVWRCMCLYYTASRRDEVSRVLCMKMHICDAQMSHNLVIVPWNSTWKAGREDKAGVLEGRRRNSTVTQTWSAASPLLLPASLWEQICDTSWASL